LTLHIRAHDGSTVMVFNEHYVPLLNQVNLLVVTNIVRRGMLVSNATAITVMVDRWRSETHSFHLPCGEVMVTLEDVAMILGLSIRGCHVTGHVDSTSWHERVIGFPHSLSLLRLPFSSTPQAPSPTRIGFMSWYPDPVGYVCHSPG
jgi:hypothetical protein